MSDESAAEAMAAQPYGTDIKLNFARGGEVDFAYGPNGLDTVSGVDNLVQALTMRLLVDRGELSGLGHPRFGSHIRDLIGEPQDSANMELLRRYVRQALLQDPRVAEVVQVVVTRRLDDRASVDIVARVLAASGEAAQVEVTFDAG